MMKKIFSNFSAIFFFIITLLILPAICYGQTNTKTKITLLSINAWLGGTEVVDGQIKTLNAVLKSGADIVGISEGFSGIGNFLAERLGWYSFVTDDNVILSRFPIKKNWTSVKGAGAEIEIENGKTIVIKVAHLNYTPYGPYRACLDGATEKQIIEEETSSGRLEEIKAALSSIDKYIKDGTPTFLMGDLNTPSHLDWTESTKKNHCGYMIEWPVTKAIQDAGMIDSYRELYPNPETYPGITWSPIYKAVVYDSGKPEPLDRLDFIYYSGNGVKLFSSEIFLIGNPEQISNHSQNEWPSDHAAVISGFSVETGKDVSKLPVAKFYASSVVINQGESISFTDISTNKPTSWSWVFEGGTPVTSTEQNPKVTFSAAGHYKVTLVSGNITGSGTTTVTNLITVK